MERQEAKKWLEDIVNDMFMDMCYYDRKEDEEMNPQQLRTLMDCGIISKEIMIEVFLNQISKEYPNKI